MTYLERGRGEEVHIFGGIDLREAFALLKKREHFGEIPKLAPPLPPLHLYLYEFVEIV